MSTPEEAIEMAGKCGVKMVDIKFVNTGIQKANRPDPSRPCTKG
jgi:hypothetical protein